MFPSIVLPCNNCFLKFFEYADGNDNTKKKKKKKNKEKIKKKKNKRIYTFFATIYPVWSFKFSSIIDAICWVRRSNSSHCQSEGSNALFSKKIHIVDFASTIRKRERERERKKEREREREEREREREREREKSINSYRKYDINIRQWSAIVERRLIQESSEDFFTMKIKEFFRKRLNLIRLRILVQHILQEHFNS